MREAEAQRLLHSRYAPLIADFYYRAMIRAVSGNGGSVTRYDVEQAGLDWRDVSKKLTENKWVEQIGPAEMRLKANLDDATINGIGIIGREELPKTNSA